jgi:HlyD family secretion protein
MSRLTGNLVRAAIVVAVIAAAGTGWFWWKDRSQPPIAERYEVEEVSYGELTQTVTANGTLNPVTLVNVGTQVSGTVKRLHADFNDEVKAGQLLLELDPTTLQAAVEQTRGELASAEADLRLARSDEARLRELFDQEYVSRQEMDKAVQTREAAQARLQAARAKLERDLANLGYSRIRSPVSGVVVSRQVDVGQTVAASFQTPTLFQIAQDLASMQIDTSVAEADIGRIIEGQNARFTVDAFPGRRFEGKVRQVRLNPTTQQNVVTYNVVVAVSNPDLVLLPGMTAYVSFVVEQRDNALLVPNAALRFRPESADRDRAGGGNNARGETRTAEAGRTRRAPNAGSTVYVVRGNELTSVPVQTGISDGRSTEITGGELKAGDAVVVQDRQPAAEPASPQQPFRIRAL